MTGKRAAWLLTSCLLLTACGTAGTGSGEANMKEESGAENYAGKVREDLVLLAGIRGKAGREEVREAIRLVGLEPGDRRPVRKYSLGMRQRLGIAQAVMEDPRYLLLDEPMNGLDGEGLTDMRELFISLKNKGKTLLIASHSREDIEILCDRVYEMDKGRIALVR